MESVCLNCYSNKIQEMFGVIFWELDMNSESIKRARAVNLCFKLNNSVKINNIMEKQTDLVKEMYK